ncbi:MAG: ABC-F family ATP-binding cassette domain-containing protein, partial [Firmicutes bacterium]|nr:ABC-F family ATP-binding cassette domain-containing protein [Bacillota bacterium]
NYSQYKERKEILYQEALKHYEQQAEEIRHEEELIARWYGRGTEKLIKRAQSREKRLAHVERLERPVILKDEIRLSFKQNLQTGNDVMFIEDLSFAYDDALDKPLIKDFNAMIKKGERVCITGPNGAGKTTLLRMLMGQLRPTEGRIKLGTNVVPAYYDQQQENLDPENTVLEEMYNCRGILIGPDEYVSVESRYNQTDLRKMLGAMCFRGDDVFKKVGSLAGGEKARLSLLKLMMSGANVLVLDEPTNHLDITSKEVFEDALLAFPGTEIIVSHDRYLIDKVSTRVIEIGTGEEAFTGIQSSEKEIGDTGFVKGSQEERLAKKKAETERRRAERKLADVEAQLGELETKKKDLENQLCLPVVFSDPAKARKVSQELEAVKTDLEEVYFQWMELQEE